MIHKSLLIVLLYFFLSVANSFASEKPGRDACIQGFGEILTQESLLERAIEIEAKIADTESQARRSKLDSALLAAVLADLGKLNFRLQEATSVNHLSGADLRKISDDLEEIRTKYLFPKKLLSEGAGASPLTSHEALIYDLVANPNKAVAGMKYQLASPPERPRFVTFSKELLVGLAGATELVRTRMAYSLSTAFMGDSLHAKKMKIMPGIHGAKGVLCEVMIIGKGGHRRILGCYKDGIFHLMKYDPRAPETGPGYSSRYGDFCR